MFNLVELIADSSEQQDAPCKWGHVVVGHACYCHNDAWTAGPRKCPIYGSFGLDPVKWHRREWGTIRLPMFKGWDTFGRPVSQEEDVPCLPDDDLGGCPKFEPRS